MPVSPGIEWHLLGASTHNYICHHQLNPLHHLFISLGLYVCLTVYLSHCVSVLRSLSLYSVSQSLILCLSVFVSLSLGLSVSLSLPVFSVSRLCLDVQSVSLCVNESPLSTGLLESDQREAEGVRLQGETIRGLDTNFLLKEHKVFSADQKSEKALHTWRLWFRWGLGLCEGEAWQG